MEIINMSKRQFNTLDEFILPKDVLSTESTLFHYRYHGQDKLLKKLFIYEGISFANKLYTIQALSANIDKMPNNFIIPEALVSISKRIEAFIMPIINGPNLSTILSDSKVDVKEQKYYLKKIGQILEQMKNIREYTPLKDFYLNDLHEANFIINPEKKELYVGDLDSCKIANNKSFSAKYLNSFSILNETPKKYKGINSDDEIGYVTADENSDLYCYNIVLLNYLYGANVNNFSVEDFYNYLNYLDYLKIDFNLLEIFNKLVSNAHNENPMNYIETLNKEQIYRAKRIVYKANKNRI